MRPFATVCESETWAKARGQSDRNGHVRSGHGMLHLAMAAKGLLLLSCVLLMLMWSPTLNAQDTSENLPFSSDTTGFVIDRSAFIFGGYGSRATRNLDLVKKFRDFNRMRTQKAISYFVFAQEAMQEQNIPLAAMHNTFSLQVMPTEDGWIQRYTIMTDAGKAEDALGSLIQAMSYSIDDYYAHLYREIALVADQIEIDIDLNDLSLYESLEAELSDYLIEGCLSDGYYNVLPGRSNFESTLLEAQYVSRYLEFFFGNETYRAQATTAIATAVPDLATAAAADTDFSYAASLSVREVEVDGEWESGREGEVDAGLEAEGDVAIEAEGEVEAEAKAGANGIGNGNSNAETTSSPTPPIPSSPTPHHQQYFILIGPYETPVQAILNQARLQVLFSEVDIILISDQLNEQ